MVRELGPTKGRGDRSGLSTGPCEQAQRLTQQQAMDQDQQLAQQQAIDQAQQLAQHQAWEMAQQQTFAWAQWRTAEEARLLAHQQAIYQRYQEVTQAQDLEEKA